MCVRLVQVHKDSFQIKVCFRNPSKKKTLSKHIESTTKKNGNKNLLKRQEEKVITAKVIVLEKKRSYIRRGTIEEKRFAKMGIKSASS